MASNLVKFCAAAFAGSLLGIAYERWPPTLSNLPGFVSTVSADSTSLVGPPKEPTFYDLDPVSSAENFKHSSKFGLPSKDNIRIFNDFVISYDRRLRAPSWVVEHLTPEKLGKQNANRNKSKFKEDAMLHEFFRAKNTDFSNSGYDRGHMAAAGNHKSHQNDMDQTFTLSNVSPQVPEFNQGAWERLESYVRWRAKRSKNLYVVTGCLFLPFKGRDGNSYVTYRVIGNNQISVPTHYFKVILVETKDDTLVMEAFLMPNDPKMTKNVQLNDYRVPISRLDMIERSSGVIFFDQLPRNKIEAPLQMPVEFRDEPRGEFTHKDKNDETKAKRFLFN